MRLNQQQKSRFFTDGVVILDHLLDPAEVTALRAAFDRLFNGQFETGIMPDEVNWQQGQSDPTLARQICNGWRADRTVAKTVLRADLGEMVATLMDWPGCRIMQDNVIWKPIGAKSLGYHQDNAYLSWFEPGEICTVWMSLDDIEPDNGTMELVLGSHQWHLVAAEGEFHAPEDYQAPMRKRAKSLGVEPEVLKIVVPAGSGSIHHGRTWHGSGANTGNGPRRSLVLHAMSSDARYQRNRFNQGTGPIYARYARLDSDQMDENYFPILWRDDGYRSPGIEIFCNSKSIA